MGSKNTFDIFSVRKWPLFWTNENVLFTKSAITSECHNIFGWNKKHFNEWLGQTMSLSNLIFWQSLWPNFNPKWSNWPKIGPKMPFFLISLNYFWCFCSNIIQNSTEFHNWSWFKISSQKKKFFAGRGSQGVQKQPKLAQNCIFVKIYTNLLGYFS